MTDPRNWTESDIIKHLERFDEEAMREYYERFKGKNQANAGATVRSPNMEPTVYGNAKGPDEGQDVHPKYRIHVHSRRRRLTDSDGISAKAAIDGLVAGGLLPDDSPKWVESVTFSQEKSEVEETILEVWQIDEHK